MGYRGNNNFDERDKLFGASSGKPGANREVKKNLDALFAPKAHVQAQNEACKDGHAWIRDWDRVFKCVRCKTLKPEQSARL
jgi:hypothetical protein